MRSVDFTNIVFDYEMGISNLKLEIHDKALFLATKRMLSKNISVKLFSRYNKIREEKDKVRDP